MECYRLAGIHVVHQKMVGEVIIVDLQAGVYFSLLDSAVQIWDGLGQGLDRSSIVEELSLVYDAPREELESAVAEIVDQLVAEKLIVPIESEAKPRRDKLAQPANKVSFLPPALQKYTDMEDVLALDPIHDFDEAGWPTAPTAPVFSK